MERLCAARVPAQVMPAELADGADGDDVELVAEREQGVGGEHGPRLLEDVRVGHPALGMLRHDVGGQHRPVVQLNAAAGVDDLDEIGVGGGGLEEMKNHGFVLKKVGDDALNK